MSDRPSDSAIAHLARIAVSHLDDGANCNITPGLNAALRRLREELDKTNAGYAAAPEEAPEPYISHTGATCIDWDDDPKNQLSIIVKDGHTTFAAFHNGEKSCGEASGPRFMIALRRFTEDVATISRSDKDLINDFAEAVAGTEQSEEMRGPIAEASRERERVARIALERRLGIRRYQQIDFEAFAALRNTDIPTKRPDLFVRIADALDFADHHAVKHIRETFNIKD